MVSKDSAALASPAAKLFLGIAISSSLVLYGIVRFPASLADGGLRAVLMTAAGLLTYALAAVWARHSSSAAIQFGVRLGTGLGLCVGGIAVINHIVEISTSLPPLAGTVLGAGMWTVMFLGFGFACSATCMKAGSVAAGVVSSAWSALTSTVVTVAFALGIGLAWLRHMERILAPAAAASGMSISGAFVVRHLVGNAASHLFIAPTIALIVGGISAFSCSLLKSVARRTAVTVGLLELVLLVAGLAAIQFASGLERPKRPPFIDFGLGALAVTLASAHPVFAAIRRSHVVDRKGRYHV